MDVLQDTTGKCGFVIGLTQVKGAGNPRVRIVVLRVGLGLEDMMGFGKARHNQSKAGVVYRRYDNSRWARSRSSGMPMSIK